jgi:hypothetical protein
MNLVQKFRVGANKECIGQPPHMELDKLYPILAVFKEMWSHYIIITLMLPLNNDKGVGFYVLSPTYSKVFNYFDISELESEPGKFKLILKKNCFVNCHYLAIET